MNYSIDMVSALEAQELCQQIIINLPQYFGIPEANQHYIDSLAACVNFIAHINNQKIGLLSLNFPYPENANIFWMGVLSDFQGQGVGRALLQKAESYAITQLSKTLTVETLAPIESDSHYLKSYEFYKKNGFHPLFNLKPIGYEWTMVYLAKSLTSVFSELLALEKEAEAFGFEWPDSKLIIQQALSECNEISLAIEQNEESCRIQEEIGDLIHTAISLNRFEGFNPEETMTKSTQKFKQRMKELQRIASEKEFKTLKGQSMEVLQSLWQEVKNTIKKNQ